MRNPFDAHLTSVNADEWAEGFELATDRWIETHKERAQAIYQAIRDSSGVDGAITLAKVDLPYEPWAEGFALGVYGIIAGQRLGIF